MTPKDIGELSYPELEGLLEGMTKNSERERAELNGESVKEGDAQDLLGFIAKNGNGF